MILIKKKNMHTFEQVLNIPTFFRANHRNSIDDELKLARNEEFYKLRPILQCLFDLK